MNQPLVKLNIDSEEIKLVFDPKSYIHLVNISRSLSNQGSSEEFDQTETLSIFQN